MALHSLFKSNVCQNFLLHQIWSLNAIDNVCVLFAATNLFMSCWNFCRFIKKTWIHRRYVFLRFVSLLFEQQNNRLDILWFNWLWSCWYFCRFIKKTWIHRCYVFLRFESLLFEQQNKRLVILWFNWLWANIKCKIIKVLINIYETLFMNTMYAAGLWQFR
jgi:hypothetical protein